MIYRDTLGEVNNVQYTFDDLGSTKEFTFTDTALIINSTGCGAPAGTTIICSTLPQTAAVRFELNTNTDTLILNASRIGGGNAGAEHIAIAPAGAGQRVTGFHPGVPVDITGTEVIRFVGNGSDDSLSVNPGSGNDTVRIQNANPNTDVVQSSGLPNIEFTGMAAFELNANAGAGNGADTITFVTRDLEGATASNYSVATDASDTLIIGGTRVDTLVHRASDVDDQFDVAATTGYVRLTNSPGTHVPVETDGVLNLTLNGLGGDDIFNVDGLHPYGLLAVQGQQPSASDVLNVTGTAGTENIRVNLEPATITGLGSLPGERISFTGVELVNINGGGGPGGGDTLTVVGTQDDDILTYEPLEAEDGKFHNDGSNTNFVFRDIGDDFTVDGGQDGADKVILVGTNDHDVIVIDTPNRVASVEDSTGVVLKPVHLATTVEDLDALGRDGDDTFLVVPAPPLSNSVDGIPSNLLIDVDGIIDGADVRIGETVAVPLDGTNQYPSGQWNVQSTVDLNDPLFFPKGGVRSILATAEDLAGNVTQVASLNIFVDTSGPVVTDVYVTSAPNYDLFDPKPSTDGPTPPVTSLTVTVRDLPARSNLDPDFLYPALLEAVIETPGNVRLVGDHSGVIAIASVDFISNPVVNGQPATGRVVLTFNQPLPDDRFTLTIFDNVVDPVGNRLDGETDTIEPEDDPRFPSGDGQPGGDFIARFTVDSRPEIATACCGSIYVDANGNFVFDPEGQDNDATNRDLIFNFGLSSVGIFAGNFAPAGANSASGFDKLGAYGYTNGKYRFLLDFDHDGVADFSSISQRQVNGIPVAGDFDPTHPGDEIGLFDGTRWYLDTNGNNILETTDLVINSQFQGLPIVGDFAGNGTDDLGTFAAGTDTFYLDLNRDGVADRTVHFGFAGILERPVTGDLNLDGVDDLGLWVPGRQGQVPREAAEWYFLVSDSPTGQFNPYSPAPLGDDLFAQFGDEFALPVFGNFDPPPAEPDGNGGTDPISLHNSDNRYDTNMDGSVTPVDVLVVINWINSPPTNPTGSTRPDVSANKLVAPGDALMVINYLNVRGSAEGEASAIVPAAGLSNVSFTAGDMAEQGQSETAPGAESRVREAGSVDWTLAVDAESRDKDRLTASTRREPVDLPIDAVLVSALPSDAATSGNVFVEPQELEAVSRGSAMLRQLDDETDELLGMLADDVARIWERQSSNG